MVRLTLLLSLFFLLFTGHALARSAVWQPALMQRNSTHLSKRYYYVDKANYNREPWEKRRIRYCFSQDKETQKAKSKLKEYLIDARKTWITKGLDSNFNIEEVSDSVCKSDRNNVLEVIYTGPDGGMGTFVGFPDSSVKMPANMGPTMRLTDSITMGMLDVVANFAHELGHAWGLYHEHQNPKFWAGVDGADGGKVFGPNNPGGWNCKNLKDYNTAVRDGLKVQTGGGGSLLMGVEKLCENYQAAINAKFTAADYLPMRGVGTAHSAGHGNNDVDWKSIMIYPSGAGGKEEGSGKVTPSNDHRAPILMQPGGTRIPINLVPSTLDIAAMNALYEGIPGTKKSLLNKMKNFRTVYKESKSGPSGGSGCL